MDQKTGPSLKVYIVMRKAIHSVYSRNVTSGPEMSYCLTKYMCIRYEAKYAFNETVLIDINGSVTPSQSASAAAASPAAAAAPAAAPAAAVPSDHAVTITCAAPRPSCSFSQTSTHRLRISSGSRPSAEFQQLHRFR